MSDIDEIKTYIFTTNRGWHGDEDKVVKSLVDSFAKIMIEQIETKAKELFIEAIHPQYRSRDIDIKFTKAFDDFIEAQNYNKEDVLNIVSERNTLRKKLSDIKDLWESLLNVYAALNVSGKGNVLGTMQNIMNDISKLIEER